MAVARFFVDLPLATGATVRLPTAVAHHAFRVLRLPEGSAVSLFNGQGGEYEALLGTAQQGVARLERFSDVEREAPLDLSLIQALVATEKLDWIVEKSTELGAARIFLLAADRSVVRLSGERLERRLQHLRGIARAACEQCGRNRVPLVQQVSSFAQAAAALPAGVVRRILAPGASPIAATAPIPGLRDRGRTRGRLHAGRTGRSRSRRVCFGPARAARAANRNRRAGRTGRRCRRCMATLRDRWSQARQRSRARLRIDPAARVVRYGPLMNHDHRSRRCSTN